GSGPEMASKIRAASTTLLVIGPITSRLKDRYRRPPLPTLPNDGLNPTTPQSAAGILTEPPVSDPKAPAQKPAATAAAEPPLDPPGILEESYGFLVGP